MEEHFLFLKSDDCDQTYPGNTPFHFSIQFRETIKLQGGNWYCSLRAIKTYVGTISDIYIYCDFVEESHVRGTKLPILCRIAPVTAGRVVERFDSSVNFKVTRDMLNTITVYIKTDDMIAPTFPDEPSTCMLHLFQK